MQKKLNHIKKIKIFLFIDSFMIGGMHKQMLYLFKYLNKDQFETVICVLDDHGKLKTEYVKTSAKIYNLNWKFTGDIKPIFRLANILRKEKPDIVFITEAVNFLYYRFSKFFFNYNSVNLGSFRALTFWKGHLNSFYKRIDIVLSRYFYKYCDSIVVNSIAMKINYENILKTKKEKPIKVIYNASDFNFKTNKQSNVIKKLGIESKIVITQVARMDPWKDFDTLLLSIKELKSKGHKIALILIGDGILKDKIKQFINDHDLISEVFLIGETNNVHEYISLSDICVLSSNGEGFSNSILEYMFHSKPVVASNVGGNNELIANGKYGRTFEKGSIIDLVKNLEELILNSDLRNLLGNASKKHIEKLCSIKFYIKSYENHFKNIKK